MKLFFFLCLMFTLFSCDLIRLLNTSEEKNESSSEISSFLKKHKYAYDYSFESIDSTYHLMKTAEHRINNDSLRYSYIQLRIYDKAGNLYSGYSQCMGNFNQRKIIDSIPPAKNTNPFLNQKLQFKDELDSLYITPEARHKLLEDTQKYDYTFVVYYTIWTNYFSEHVLSEVSKTKRSNPDKIRVVLVNTAREKSPDNQ